MWGKLELKRKNQREGTSFFYHITVQEANNLKVKVEPTSAPKKIVNKEGFQYGQADGKFLKLYFQ